MFSSLLTGVSGLRANQTMLSVIGNNLANINTPGFKASAARFSELLARTLRSAAGGEDGGAGGVNPMQIGNGAQVAAIDRDLSQGSLMATGRPFDLAIQGQGFFVVRDGGEKYYTRVGAFDLDAASYLVDPATGFRVLDVDNSEIQIDYSVMRTGKMTSYLDIDGNFAADAVKAVAVVLGTRSPFTTLDVDGEEVAAARDTLLNDLTSVTTAYVDGDVIEITGTDPDGNPISATFAYQDGSTLGDLVDAISDEFGDYATVELDAEGEIIVTAKEPGATPLSLALSDQAGNTGGMSFDQHLFDADVAGTDGTKYTTSTEVFDQQGVGHLLTLTFEKMDDNEWDLTVSMDEGEGEVIDGKVEGITFDDDGEFSLASGVGEGDPGITVRFGDLETAQDLDIRFAAGPDGSGGVTQRGEEGGVFVGGQDGLAVGHFRDISVLSNGLIQANFTNGEIDDLATLQVATFGNPEGLSQVGGGYYVATPSSGEAVGVEGGSGRAGVIQAGALEGSNVDVAMEFARLITAQRGFQVSARTITTTNEILEDLVNLVR